MKDKNLDALHSSMDILIIGLHVSILFELNGNLTDSTVFYIHFWEVPVLKLPVHFDLHFSLFSLCRPTRPTCG